MGCFRFFAAAKSIVETLPNGLKIVCPVINCLLFRWLLGPMWAVRRPKSYTEWLMFEHMAFKGTDEIEYNKPAKEVRSGKDAIFEQLRLERLKGDKGDKRKLERLEKTLKKRS